MNRKLIQYSYEIQKQTQKKVWFVIIYVILLFIFINLILDYVIFPVKQNSISMLPDVPEQSYVMVSPLNKTYERGDIVLLKSRYSKPANKLQKLGVKFCAFFTGRHVFLNENDESPSTKEKLRRIVGVPGDTIFMRDYVVYIKEKGEKHFLTEFEITPKTYNVTFFVPPAGWNSSIGIKGTFEEITLGEDEYFVLGDNRKSADDSRLWGTVSSKDIKAKALLCYYPFKNIKLY
ncbi:MAG: signal peptidase I [Treponema sp.]|nr:signal peptidase I [Treponema sp.]